MVQAPGPASLGISGILDRQICPGTCAQASAPKRLQNLPMSTMARHGGAHERHRGRVVGVAFNLGLKKVLILEFTEPMTNRRTGRTPGRPSKRPATFLSVMAGSCRLHTSLHQLRRPVRFARCARRWYRISPPAWGTVRGQVHLGSGFRAYRCRATTHLAIYHRPSYERQGSRHKFLAVQPHMSRADAPGPGAC